MPQDGTQLDRAHAAMEAAPEDDAARLRFYERLADSELFLLLEREAEGDQITPRSFDLPDGPVVLIFDREDRLADFVQGGAPFAAMSGRMIVRLLAGQGIGLGLNLEVAPSSILIPAEALDWLATTLDNAPKEATESPSELTAPSVPVQLVEALSTKLVTAAGLASGAYLSGVVYSGGRRSHLLAFIDPVPGAEPALAQAASEALTFSGIEAGVMDVTFFAATHPISAQLARTGLRFDLPEPAQAGFGNAPSAPGMDPDKPPRLR